VVQKRTKSSNGGGETPMVHNIVCCSKAQDVDRVFCQCTKGTVEIIEFPWVKLEALPI
jgi:hypothetical protein